MRNAIRNLLLPQASLAPTQVDRGVRNFMIEGAATMGLGSMTGGGFIAAYALVLGANNQQIGILAALPFITMPLQVFTVAAVEKYRRRKMIAVPAWVIGQSLWFPIALVPILVDVPSAGAVSILLTLVGLRSLMVATQNAAWNSWVRDLVPNESMGRIFATRLRYANIAAMLLGLGAGLFVDWWESRSDPADLALGYMFALLAGAVFLGTTSVIFRALIPEPQLAPRPDDETRPSVISALIEPFKDPNYRPLLRFQFFWALALHLATPFFAVYMLTRLDLSVAAVMGFTVLSQLFNVLFLRFWGPLVDQVGNKAVLSVSASLYLLVILGWTFTTLPERYFLTIPLLIVLHMLAGAAAAGATLTTGTIGFKLAPPGKGTAYMSSVSIVSNLGAAIGPLIGGRLADFLSLRTLSIDMTWIDPSRSFNIQTLNLTGFDFLFGMTFLIGLLTLTWLGRVKEPGEHSRDVVIDELFSGARRATVPMSSIPGFGLTTQFSVGAMRAVPGLDAAVGVAAYQVTESTRMASSLAHRGIATYEEGVERISNTIRSLIPSRFMSDEHNLESEHAEQIAVEAAKGAVISSMDSGASVSDLTEQAIGATAVISQVTDADPAVVLRAASYGAIQGAIEAAEGPRQAAESAVRRAASEAPGLGIPVQAAVAAASEGALAASKEFLTDGQYQIVREAVERVSAEFVAE